jgi:Cu(I)/Ag(I) efflux system protein CusF
MKHLALACAALLIAGCNAAPDASTPPAASPAAAAPATEPAPTPATPPAVEARQATAIGVVQSVDVGASTLVIDHEPVESLDWPRMTMTFQAPGVDLSGIQPGDTVSFEFTSVGMDGTIISISRQ